MKFPDFLKMQLWHTFFFVVGTILSCVFFSISVAMLASLPTPLISEADELTVLTIGLTLVIVVTLAMYAYTTFSGKKAKSALAYSLFQEQLIQFMGRPESPNDFLYNQELNGVPVHDFLRLLRNQDLIREYVVFLGSKYQELFEAVDRAGSPEEAKAKRWTLRQHTDLPSWKAACAASNAASAFFA